MKTETKIIIGRIRIGVVASVAALAAAFLVHAQETTLQHQHSGSTSPMMDMMQKGENQCAGSMKQCQDVMAELRAARDSNDATKMRAAIDEALNTCTQMNQNMSNCMSNMTNCTGMMRMHGGAESK